ncbi:Dyp-type peroxidase domain-containing protein, partial [Streptococcus pyogenes]
HGLAYPEGVTDFHPRESRKHRAPHTDCDVFIHLHGLRHDLNFYVFQQWLTPIKKVVDVVDETAGFRYLDARDMTGFIDGTENPQGL